MTEPQPMIKPKLPPLIKTDMGIVMNLFVWNAEYTPTTNPNNPPTINPMKAPLSMLVFALDAAS